MNNKTVVSTPNAPSAIGPYSQAIRAGGMLFVSGQIPLNPATGKPIEDTGIKAQTRQVLENLLSIVRAAGGSAENIVRTTVFLR
ncbi:MAG TPA: Rid family hydrolase, partial [Terriglobia bacterium]|nr:Rid family hydrolase [Terriglobia bacterium]